MPGGMVKISKASSRLFVPGIGPPEENWIGSVSKISRTAPRIACAARLGIASLDQDVDHLTPPQSFGETVSHSRDFDNRRV